MLWHEEFQSDSQAPAVWLHYNGILMLMLSCVYDADWVALVMPLQRCVSPVYRTAWSDPVKEWCTIVL